MHHQLKSILPDGTLAIVLTQGIALDAVDEEMMGRLGWKRC